MNKILVINKEKGITSRDVVNKLCQIFHTKKIGHTGTLDPIASGVLVCLIGKYTKLVNLITAYDKEYIATIKLGMKTDTLDITGNILEEQKIPELNKEKISQVLASFIGDYESEVPIYSAIHVNGKRLYEYARHNEKVILPKRIFTIKEIELISYQDDLITFRVLVSKGTYIRSLIQSICKELNTIGCMSELIRTKQGKFTIENANSLQDIQNNNYHSLDLPEVLDVFIKEINSLDYNKIINGNLLKENLTGYVLYTKNKEYIALYHFENSIGKLIILFSN